MLELVDKRISKVDGKYFAKCKCNKKLFFSTKNNAKKMLDRGYCRSCRKNYINADKTVEGVYQNPEKKWCSSCSGCGIEQAYTRKDHAKQSTLADWQCKKCVASSKKLRENHKLTPEKRLFNKFSKSAIDRGIKWELTEESMFYSYTGLCALTGWEIKTEGSVTASLDRIDSSKGYSKDNIQWVHKLVNMCKNKYNQEDFICMCKAVSDNLSKEKW